MQIIQLVQSKLSEDYQIKQWNLANTYQKQSSSQLWRKFHFSFMFASALFHATGAFIITPPFYDAIRHMIQVANISSWLFVISSLNFLFAILMENVLQLKHSSQIQRALLMICLTSASLFVISSLKLTSSFYDSTYGDILWIVAAFILMAGKLASLSIMTGNDVINGLIMCRNQEFRYQARLFGVGIIQTISGVLFIYASFYHRFYSAAALCLLLASILRVRTSLRVYSCYFPGQFGSNHQWNLADSIF